MAAPMLKPFTVKPSWDPVQMMGEGGRRGRGCFVFIYTEGFRVWGFGFGV